MCTINKHAFTSLVSLNKDLALTNFEIRQKECMLQILEPHALNQRKVEPPITDHDPISNM